MKGQEFINKINSTLPFQLQLCDQQREGRIGFLTAVAAFSIQNKIDLKNLSNFKSNLISFDQGGFF